MKAKVLTKGADYWLVQRARRNDPVAWAELWERNLPHLRHFLARRIMTPSIREEVEQETAIKVWRNIGQFRGKCAFHYWVFSIAVREAGMYFRRNARHHALSINWSKVGQVDDVIDYAYHVNGETEIETIDESMQFTPDPIAGIDARKTLARVRDRLSRIPDMYGNVWTARRVGQFSNEETAAMLEITVPAVKSRLHRAARQIARALRVANG
jgi:RNA polymerase sigma-70 factor, ECF subfamily